MQLTDNGNVRIFSDIFGPDFFHNKKPSVIFYRNIVKRTHFTGKGSVPKVANVLTIWFLLSNKAAAVLQVFLLSVNQYLSKSICVNFYTAGCGVVDITQLMKKSNREKVIVKYMKHLVNKY